MKTVLYVLTATHMEHANGVPPDTYVFKDYDDSNRFAMHLIAEYVDGEWHNYNKRFVKNLRALVEAGRLADARRLWNDYSTFELAVEDVELKDGSDPAELWPPDFHWPDSPGETNE